MYAIRSYYAFVSNAFDDQIGSKVHYKSDGKKQYPDDEQHLIMVRMHRCLTQFSRYGGGKCSYRIQ